MKAKRKRRAQVTCLCHAYEFPHRLGGGRCSGAAWATSYFEYERGECAHCHANAGTHCEIAVEQEKIKYCDGFRDHLRAEPDLRHPLWGKRLEEHLDRSHSRYPSEEIVPYMELEEIPF